MDIPEKKQIAQTDGANNLAQKSVMLQRDEPGSERVAW
jgi:hypothetical protein